MQTLCLRNRVLHVALLTCFMVTCTTTALGQTQFGSIGGVVTDPTGANVPGVAIRAINEATNTGFSTMSTPAGDYLIEGLLPGVYTVSGSKAGFSEYRFTGITVVAGQVSRADLHFAVGATSQSVTVKAEAGSLGTESAAVADHILTSYIDRPATVEVGDQSPSETTVMELQGHVDGGGRSVEAYGIRSYDRRVTLDGAVLGFSSATGIIMPRGSVGEVEAAALNADAEHQTGNTSEMFTKRGANQLHGEVWNELRNGALEALPWYVNAPRTAGTPMPSFGFSVGGPVYFPRIYNGHDKTFFFAAYQRFYEPYQLTENSTVPNDAMRAGDLQELGVPIVDPTTQQPFLNNTIPTDRISPIATKILDRYYPSIGSTPFGYGDISWVGPQYHTYWAQFYRVDHQFGSKNSLSVSYLYDHTPFDWGAQGETGGYDLPRAYTGWNYQLQTFNFVNLSDVHAFSPSVLNEFDFGVRMGIHTLSTQSTNGIQELTALGLPVAADTPNVTGLPDIEVTGITHVSDDFATGESDWRVYTVRDHVSWVKGRFSTKVGFESVTYSGTSLSYGSVFGNYNFTGFFTGTGFGDFLLGLPSSTSRSLPSGVTGSRQHQLGVFGQEYVRLNSRLNFNAGLRVQYNAPPIEPFGRYYNFDPKTGDLIVPNQASLSEVNPGLGPELLAHIMLANDAGFPTHLVNSHVTFDPRAGIAYQVSNNLVFRVGYGLYHNLLANGAPMGSAIFAAGSESYTNTNVCVEGSCTPAFTLANPFPGGGVNAVSGLAVNGVNPDLHIPQTHQWNATLEQRLRGGVVVRGSYVGSKSTFLPYQRNINLPPASAVPFTSERLNYPDYYSVNYADSGGNQTYNAFDLEFDTHVAHGLSLRGGWTYVKCLSDVDEDGQEFHYGSLGPLGPVIEDPYNRSRDKGNCSQIPTHTFRTFFVYDLPLGKGQRFLGNPTELLAKVANAAFGGWSVSGFYHAHTGKWYTPEWSGFDAANTGETLIRPDRICSGVPTHQDDHHVYDPSCFVVPADGSYGNSGRGILQDLGLWKLDAGMYKTFRFSANETMPRFRVGFTSVNIFNHPGKESTGLGPWTANSVGNAAIANDTVYDSGAINELGGWRQIRFQMQILF